MNMGAKVPPGLLLAWSTPAILANGYFTGCPSTPYPPGCAHPPIADDPVAEEPQTAAFFDDTIMRPEWQTGEWIEVKLRAYRSRCSQPADRETVGSVTLTSNSCNDLTFDYDYSNPGLGTGSARMVQAVETYKEYIS